MGELEQFSDRWLDLVMRSGGSYFTTPDWMLSWLRANGGGRRVKVAIWEDPSSGFEAIVPLFRHVERLDRRLPLTVSAWCNLGSGIGSGDHVGFPAMSERATDVGRWLRTVSGRSPVLLRSLPPGDQLRLGLDGATLIEEFRCPRMTLEPDPVPAAFRKKLRYYRRRLEAEGVSFTIHPPGGVDGPLLDALFDLHEARWDLKPEASRSDLRGRRDFFLDLCRRGGTNRGPSAVAARRGDDIVGVLLGFEFNGTFSFFQNGWEPELRNLSIGTAIVDVAVEHAMTSGAAQFDFLRGTTDYKYRFGGVDAVDQTWLLPRGVGGRLLRFKYTSGRRLAR